MSAPLSVDTDQLREAAHQFDVDTATCAGNLSAVRQLIDDMEAALPVPSVSSAVDQAEATLDRISPIITGGIEALGVATNACATAYDQAEAVQPDRYNAIAGGLS